MTDSHAESEDDVLSFLVQEPAVASDVVNAQNGGVEQPCWKVLVVDDEEEIHIVTRLALQDFSFAGRHLEFASAYSGAEAKQLIREQPDTAIILLDVVMESDEAGLDVARYIRQELGNHFVRIILRTGQPGLAPERRVLKMYDINDYRAKTELTQDRMFSVIYTALSSYRDLIALARSRHQLIGLVNEIEQLSHLAARDLQLPLNHAVASVRKLAAQSDIQPPAVVEEIKDLRESVYAMQAALNKLVALTSVGRFNESREQVDCNALISDVVKSLETQFQTSQANIHCEALPTVYGCRRQLVQLFQNLISNAIKFTEGHPPEIYINAVTHERNWLFSVTDTGIGISPERHSSVFNLFHRDTNNAGETVNSGVGLAICEKIVRWHGGRIWLESELGKGSTFYFTLPLNE